jgi:ATP-dependent Clp protease adaptor protein ClpS
MSETKSDTLHSVELKEPPMGVVILHNDDYTTMEFVVNILMLVFHKSGREAERIMMDVHKKGRGICGVYPLEVAETKVKQVELLAERHKFPLKCTVQEEG